MPFVSDVRLIQQQSTYVAVVIAFVRNYCGPNNFHAIDKLMKANSQYWLVVDFKDEKMSAQTKFEDSVTIKIYFYHLESLVELTFIVKESYHSKPVLHLLNNWID